MTYTGPVGFQNTIGVAENFDFSGTGNVSRATSGLLTDNEIWLGRTALNAGNTHVNVTTLTAGTGVALVYAAGSPNTLTINATGSTGPTVLTQVTTDTIFPFNTAAPAANNLNIFGGTSKLNNTNGVQTLAAVNEVDIELTNRVTGTVQTVGAVASNILTMDVSTLSTFVNPTSPANPLGAGIFKLLFEICAWDNANATGSTYELQGAIKSNGVGGLATVGTPVRIMNGDSAVFEAELVDVNVLGSVIRLEATGIAGRTIRWTGILNYTFGGA